MFLWIYKEKAYPPALWGVSQDKSLASQEVMLSLPELYEETTE